VLRVYSKPYIEVIDDLLEPPEWDAVVEATEAVALRETVPGTAIWHGAVQEHPKESYQAIVWPPRNSDALIAKCSIAAEQRSLPMRFYPTGTALDIGLEAVMNAAAKFRDVVGKELEDWVAVTTSIYAYSAGTRAMWHDDGRYYSGAYIYYTHRTWERDWGGDLLVTAPGSSDGIGTSIFPRPNRLVLIQSGAPHGVSRISTDAGTHIRRSMTGFFVKHHRAEELVRMVLDVEKIDGYSLR
jgi:hypothetical protein